MRTKKKLAPLEAMELCIWNMWFKGGGAYFNRHNVGVERRWNTLRPGALVERMSESVRQDLKELKGHHFDSMMMDKWRFMDAAYEHKIKTSEELMEFDKKILR